MLQSAKGLRNSAALRNKLENKIGHSIKDVASQKRQEINRRERVASLGRAIEKVKVAAAERHIERLMQKYLSDHRAHQGCSLLREET